MRTIEATRRPDAEALLGQPVEHHEPNVTAGTVVRDAETGAPVLVTVRYSGDMGAWRRGARAYPQTSTVYRAGGLRSRTRAFGFISANTMLQRDGCRACEGAGKAPEAHAVVVSAAPLLAEQLATVLPDVAARDAAAAAAVPDDWRMLGTQWTSGVLNESAPLPYHFDRNNLTPVWSAMLIARRGTRGGHLHVPEYDLTVECRDGDVVWFPGWGLLHGVTPITRTKSDGYRLSAVFYAVAKMRNCLPFEEEVARSRRRRSEREDDLRPGAERLAAKR